MEGVEDIPGTALHEGIQWEWETFPEYLDALDRREYAIDIAALTAARAAARLRDGRARRAQRGRHRRRHRRRWPRIVREAIEAGALGFSTSRTLNHKTLDGELVPGTFAAADELVGLGAGRWSTRAAACSRSCRAARPATTPT